MNKSLIFLKALTVLSVMSVHASEHERNLEILDSIPLIPDLERPASDENHIKENLVAIFASFAKRNQNKDGSLNRGTHSKGQCFDGNFKIFSREELKQRFSYSDDLIGRIKKGLFEIDETLRTEVRLANADGLGRRQRDGMGDVRGLSYTVYSDSIDDFAGSGRQDFMMNSTPGFSNGSILGFYEVVKTANTLVYRDFTYKPNPLHIGEIVSGLSAIAGGNSDHENISSLADINYWSNIPYTHGVGSHLQGEEVVKFEAEPCSGIRSQNVDLEHENYLQEDIVKRAEDGSICFDIKLQFFNRDKLLTHKSFKKRKFKKWDKQDWIENGGLDWPESVLPFYHVARITVPKGSTTQDCSTRYVNTRIHSTVDNLPIGSISRVRTYVEEKSRANRMK